MTNLLTILLISIIGGIIALTVVVLLVNTTSSVLFVRAAKKFFEGIGVTLNEFLENSDVRLNGFESFDKFTLRNSLESESTYSTFSPPVTQPDPKSRDPHFLFRKSLLAKGYTEVENPVFTGTSSTSQLIPKTIHMVESFGSQKLPSYLQRNINDIQRQNPEYSITVYTETDVNTFMASAPSALFEAYKACNNEFMAIELFKMYIVFKQGGVFLDNDLELLKPLFEIIKRDDHFLLADTSFGSPHAIDRLATSLGSDGYATKGGAPDGVYCTKFIMSVQGHPYLLEALVMATFDILNTQNIYERKYARSIKVGSSYERQVSLGLRGRYGRKFLAGSLLFTRAVSPLAIGLRRDGNKTLIDIPQHRFIGSIYDNDFPMRTIKSLSKLGYYSYSTLNKRLQDGKVTFKHNE